MQRRHQRQRRGAVHHRGELGARRSGANHRQLRRRRLLPALVGQRDCRGVRVPEPGAFVLGDVSAAGGGAVTWWGSPWAKVNSLSGGAAPPSFKGFAATVSLPTSTPPAACGSPWSAPAGNSAPPTDTVPQYMGVLVRAVRSNPAAYLREHHEDRRGQSGSRLCAESRTCGHGHVRRNVL